MSLLLTQMQNWREQSNVDKNETRPSRYGALNLAVAQTNAPDSLASKAIKDAAMESIGRTLQTPVINYDAGVTIGNSRSVTIADDENTSTMHNFTFTTYTFGFTQVPTLYKNNEIDRQRDFNAKLDKYIIKLGKTLDSAVISTLATAKTQVFADDLNYTVTGNVVQAANTDQSTIMGDLNVMMEANDHYDNIHLLGNGGVKHVLNQLKKEGLYNQANQQYEYDDKVLHFSTRLTNSAGQFANMYAVQSGSIGLLYRFEREALAGTTTADGHSWGIEYIDDLGIPMGTYFYESVGDYSAIAGAASADMDRVVKNHYGFAVDVCIHTVYNSDPTTIANPIMAATILDPA